MGAVGSGPSVSTHSRESEERDGRTIARRMPMLLTVDDVAELLRTSKRAIYTMIERRQVPGVVRIGRRVLLRSDELLHWLNQKSAPSLTE